MLKFEYHPQTDSLYVQLKKERPRSITKSFTTHWGASGFVLEPENHWITFTTYPNRITVFYKEVQENQEATPEENWPPNLAWKDWVVSSKDLTPFNQKITYYQKDLPKQEVISFTFTPQDEVHKVDGQWIKKHD